MSLKSYFPLELSDIHVEDTSADLSHLEIEVLRCESPEVKVRAGVRNALIGKNVAGVPKTTTTTTTTAAAAAAAAAAVNDDASEGRAGRHCYFCYKRVDEDDVDAFRPCGCKLMWVHKGCAVGHQRQVLAEYCLQCRQPSLLYKYKICTPRGITVTNRCSPILEVEEEEAERTTAAGNGVEQCFVCQGHKYTPPTQVNIIRKETKTWCLQKVSIAESYNAQLLRPCFCGTSAHHGCMVELLKKCKACQSCGVAYRHSKYGSTWDYFVRYWFQYVFFAVVLFLVAFLAHISISNSVLFHRVTAMRIFFTVIGALFTFCAVAGVFSVIKHTLCRRIPRFKARYGEVTVANYAPAVPSRRNVREGHERDALETVAMQPIAPPPATTADVAPAATTSKSLEEGLGAASMAQQKQKCEQHDEHEKPTDVEHADLSLGQYLFGVGNDAQSSSTPIDDVQSFSFQSTDESHA